MGRKTRYMPEEIQLFEIANRTIQGRFLLRPGPELNEIVQGVLARAQRLYGVDIVAVAVMSNHFHMLIGACSAEEIASFMRYFKSNLAREAGRLHDWSGPFWDRRYEIQPVDNTERDQVARLRYLLAQGCKENLVWTPREWPGFTTLHALTSGEPIRGVWINRSEKYRAERRGEDRPESHYRELEECSLVALPCWAHLPVAKYRERVLELAREIEDETRRRHAEERTEPRGLSHILDRQPHHRPESVKRSPAPWIHAYSETARAAYRNAYSWFLLAYREASRSFHEGDLTVEFPVGCFRPRPPYAQQARAPA